MQLASGRGCDSARSEVRDTMDLNVVNSGANNLLACIALRESYGLDLGDLRAMAHVAHTKMTSAAFGEALRIYSVLALLAPDEIGFQVGLADAAIAERNFELALTAAALIISIDPADARGYYLSGRASLGLGLHAEAREDLALAVKVAGASGTTRIGELAERLLASMRAA